MTPTEIYLWSGITVLVGFNFIIYMWLKPLINAKFKYMMGGGQGVINFSKDGGMSFTIKKPSKNETVTIKGREKVLSTSIRQYKFLGIPSHIFVPDVPTPVDIFEGAEKYTGVSDRELDTHAANMTNDFLKEFWMKWKDILIILIIVLICLMCGLAFLMYKDFQNSKICVDTVVQTISPIIAPTI